MPHENVTADPGANDPAPMPMDAERVAPGIAIGQYKLLSLLGEGGFGSVYLAEQSAPMQRRVAIKLIKPGMDSRSVLARFEAERQALALMDHPSVAKVFDGGLTPHGRPFFVMELVRGEPITRYCDLERMSVDERVWLMIQVCAAVQHAHIKGVLHRDLKPSNILVSQVDGKPLPRVIDFGVAKALNQRLSESTIHTEMGQMIGTPEYMSPEQARGSADVDTRADIYALGAILYELLTGVTPVDLKDSRSAGYASVERTIEEIQPAAPSQRLSQLMRAGQIPKSRAIEVPTIMKRVRGELDWIVLKCLEKERSRRYDSAAALAEDLDRYLNDEPVHAGPPSATYRASKFVRRHRVAVSASVMVALALLIGVIGAGYGFARAKLEAEAASRARDESETVTTFLTQMIHSVQPDESGRDATVRQVLDESAPRLAKDFAGRPTVEARLRQAVGLSYWSLGELEEAEKHLPRVVELRNQTLGPNHEDTLVAISNLASLRLEQGRLVEAEDLLNQSIDGLTKTLGDDHRTTLGALNNLAVIYARRGMSDRALAMYRRVYEGQKRARGAEHEHTLGALVNLADLLADMSRFNEAEPLLRQAVKAWERAHGSDAPGTLLALHSVGMFEMNRGHLDDAELTIKRVVEGRTRTYGENHIETLSALANLGIIHNKQGKSVEAEANLASAWNGLRTTLGDGHPTTLLVLAELTATLDSQGWPARTQSIVQQIVGSARALARADLPASNLNDLAWTLLHIKPVEQSDIETALSIATRACDKERAAGLSGQAGPNLWMFLDTLATAQHLSGAPASALASQREAMRLIPASGEQYRAEMEQRANDYELAAATK